MKEITIMELLRTNILLEKGVCESLSEALYYDGPENGLAKRMAEKTIQSFARSLNILGRKADLYMGASNVPYERQSSLRILRRDCSPDDVLRAIMRMFMVERGAAYGCEYYELPPEARKLSSMSTSDVKRLYRYLEPMFIVLEMEEMTEEAVVSAYMAR